MLPNTCHQRNLYTSGHYGPCTPPTLRPLPPGVFDLAEWSTVVRPDIHVKVGKMRYSIPWKHIGATLFGPLGRGLVQFFDAHGELVKTHLFKISGRQWDDRDYPPGKIAFFQRTPTWCRRRAAQVGPACAALIDELLGENALYRLRRGPIVLIWDNVNTHTDALMHSLIDTRLLAQPPLA